MTTKDAASLYARSGHVAPPDIAAPSAEHIRGSRRKMLDGIEFRSTLEADSYQLIKSWERAGAITNLELQPKFLLQEKFQYEGKTIRAITYKADFRFTDRRPGARGETVVVESKGFRTQPYVLRRKLFLAKYGVSVIFEEWTRETLRGLL